MWDKIQNVNLSTCVATSLFSLCHFLNYFLFIYCVLLLYYEYTGICASEPIMLVMELARLGPLNKYLRSHNNTATIATISLFMYQVCEVCVRVCVRAHMRVCVFVCMYVWCVCICVCCVCTCT